MARFDKATLTWGRWLQCCQLTLDNCQDGAARAYARAGMDGRVERNSGFVQAQAIYLRGNMGEWSGAQAREIKRTIDAFAKWGLAGEQ